jgi:hypothetical protein
MRVIVCGDRHWRSEEVVLERLYALPDTGHLIVEGGASGADTIGRKMAFKLGIDVVTFWANWQLRKRAAGPIRNDQMLYTPIQRSEAPQIDLVLAFHSNLEASKGTRDMLQRAAAANVPYEVIG